MNFLNALKETTNFTTTENGAGALKSTGNACLDAFGSLGAMRQYNKSDNGTKAVNTFMAAYRENPELAMRMLFWLRDIRGGAGERQTFRYIVTYLATEKSDIIEKNLPNFIKYGRADDILCLLETPAKKNTIRFIHFMLNEDFKAMADGKSISLMAKWLPSPNCSSEKSKYFARMIYKGLNMTERQYRKMLVRLRKYLKVVESKMSAREWDKIVYEDVPAKAAMRYAKAFYRHDERGYLDYLTDVTLGKAKVNAKSLFPFDIVDKIYKTDRNDALNRTLLDAQWKALPDYFKDRNESAICMVDTSGSMSGDPIRVAISLGLYCADKCSGPFKGHFITFDEHPTLQTVTGRDIYEKVYGLKQINCWNTDIEAAFDLILQTAIQHNAKQEDIPDKLYIISDMQFDEARGKRGYSWRCSSAKPMTFMQTMRKKYAQYGYTLPSIVYWNVRESKCGMFQETVDGENCAMVSGYSPSLFEAVIKGTTYETVQTEDGKEVIRQKIDPMTVMMNTLMDERYDSVIWE